MAWVIDTDMGGMIFITGGCSACSSGTVRRPCDIEDAGAHVHPRCAGGGLSERPLYWSHRGPTKVLGSSAASSTTPAAGAATATSSVEFQVPSSWTVGGLLSGGRWSSGSEMGDGGSPDVSYLGVQTDPLAPWKRA